METEKLAWEQLTYVENKSSSEDREMEQLFRERDAKKEAEEFRKKTMPEYNSLEWRVKKRTEAKEAERKSIKAAAIKKKKKREKNKIIAKGFAIGALATLITIGGVKLTKEVADRIEYRAAVKEAVGVARNAAEEKLIEAGLASFNEDGNIIIGDNSISDYTRLDLTDVSPVVIRAYDEALNDPEEFEDFIRAVGYKNNLYNYTGTTQYYIVNGYFDPATKEPSRDIYITYTNMNLVDALSQEQIDSLINGETSQMQGRSH